MVAYGAMEGERIYIGGSLYVIPECQNVEGVLPNRIFTHEDAKMLRPPNVFRKTFTKQEGSEDEPLGSDMSSSSPSLTAASNASSAEERDSETELEIAKAFASKRKEKVVHRILCEDNQDIQVVEVGDDDESDENVTPGISTIVTTTTSTTTSTTTTSSTSASTPTVSAATTATAPKKSRIDKLCEKLRENSSFGKSEDVKYTNQLEGSTIPSNNGLTSGKESPQPSKTLLLQETGSQNETTVSPPPLNPPHLSPATAELSTPMAEKPESKTENNSLKLLRHHLRKESVATASTSFAESDMKRESYMKTPLVTTEKEKSSERTIKKSISIKARKSSELNAKLDIILPVTYTASLKKSKSRDGLSACPIVLTAVRHRLKECSVVLHDCKVSVGESCSAILFEQKKYKCCRDSHDSTQTNQNKKSPMASAAKTSKESSFFSESHQKSERKRTRSRSSPSLPKYSLPAQQAQALPASSSLAPQPTPWTVVNPLSALQQPPLKTPRVATPTSIPTSVFPAVTPQPQTAHLKSTTPSSVPPLTDDSKKAYPLLTQALTSIGSINHSSAPRFRQELYLSSNSGPTALLGQKPLDPSPLSSVSHSQFMPANQEMMYVKPETSAEHDLRSSIFSSQFASFIDHVNRPLHQQEFTEAYTHSKPQFPKWLHLQNQLLSYD